MLKGYRLSNIRHIMRLLLIALCIIDILRADESHTPSDKTIIGDFHVGYAYQHFVPNYIPNTYIETTGLNIIRCYYDPSAVFWGKSLFTYLKASISYEFTPDQSPQQKELIELSNEQKNAWERTLGKLELDLSFLGDVPFYLRYSSDKQIFLSTVQSKEDYWFLSNTSTKLLLPGDTINIHTTYQEQMAGVGVKSSIPLTTEIGWFTLKYNRPLLSSVLTTVETIYDANMQVNHGTYFLFLFGNLQRNGWQLDFVYKIGWEAFITVAGGQSLSDTWKADFGRDGRDSGYYFYAYDVGLSIKNDYFIPINARIEYRQRHFQEMERDQFVTFNLNFDFSY